MARQTGSSQASITRFARALGYKDVRELKTRLAQSLAVGQRVVQDVPDLDGIQGIYASMIRAVEDQLPCAKSGGIAAWRNMAQSSAPDPGKQYGGRVDFLCLEATISFIPPRITLFKHAVKLAHCRWNNRHKRSTD